MRGRNWRAGVELGGMRLTALVLTVLSALVFALPASADTTEDLHETCDNPDGHVVVTADSPFSGSVATPIGFNNIGANEDAGSYMIDLAGEVVGTRVDIGLTLSDDGLASDYDLVVNGVNEATPSSGSESHTVKARHCQVINLETSVWLGLPTDALNLSVKFPFGF